MKALILLLFMSLLASCEKIETNDVLRPANTRSDSLNVNPATDIYIEVDTVLNEYDVDIGIHTMK